MSKNMENIRRQAMENSEELQDFLRDLGNWEQEIKKKDEQLRKETNEPNVPAEKQEPVTKQEENKEEEEKDDDDDCSSSADEENGDDEEITSQQLKQKALLEKDRGNKFFSEGKYDDAIACYTSGIQADPTNAVLPANRAMALIKKGQLAAAEQDCTLSISLDYTYAKAFHRRGTCRFALKKLALARQDFLKVMELEPGNKFAKVELEKLEQEFRRRDVAKTDPVNSKTPTSNNMLTTGESSESPPKPLNSRLQDQTVFTGGLISKQPSVVDGQSSVGAKHKESGAPSNKNVELKKKSFFSDLPDQVKPVYKAGHLRSKSALQRIAIEVHSSDEDSEEPTIVVPVHRPTWLPTSTANKSKMSPKPSPSTPVITPTTPQSLPDVPQTAFQFETDWRRLRHWPQFKVQYLKNIQPENLRHMYHQSMETEIFIDILHCIQEFSNEDKQLALQYLKSLTQIGRFSTTVLFLSAAETQIVKDILSVVSSVASSEEIKSLQLLFQL